MVTVTILCEKGRAVGFTCAGHADYADEGTDIVCSAISALTQTAVLGIREVAKISAGVSVREGEIRCVIDRDTDLTQLEKADLLLSTMAAGLRAIDKAYPNTLKISDREV